MLVDRLERDNEDIIWASLSVNNLLSDRRILNYWQSYNKKINSVKIFETAEVSLMYLTTPQ